MGEKIRCLIIDDEEMAIKVIESFVGKVDSLELVASCQNAYDAFNLLSKEKIDLIFLDIQMPQLTGLEFIKSLSNPPHMILTTAYREYAHEGFDLDVLDYLVKPIAFSRFLKAIGKISRLNSLPKETELVLREKNYDNAYIFVKCGKNMEKIWFRDVLFIESIRDYVKIHTIEKVISTYLKISYMEERLPHSLFLRTHKSFMVALKKINSYSMTGIDIGEHHIPIGNYYKKQVLDRLAEDGETLL